MQQQIDLDQLRELFLAQPESETVRILAMVLSGALLSVVLILVRRRTLREEYTPIWVIAALATTVLSLRLDVLTVVTRTIGAWTPSSTIFFLGEVFLVMLCLNYAVRLSNHDVQIKTLAQEVALLEARLEAASADRDADESG